MPQGYHLKTIDIDKIKKLANEGLSITVICQRTGLKRSAVYRVCRLVKR
jgi:DNA-binding IclR family transcriptional regulator